MQIEPLEPRLLLTSATLQDDLLTVEGSLGRDRIRVTVWLLGTGNTIDILINGHRQPVIGTPPHGLFFAPRLMIRAGAGDDSVNVWIPNSWLNTTIHGGSGNDQINVRARGTLALGDSGDDVIKLAPNTLEAIDSAFGGDGNDRIVAMDFGCELHGGNGSDTLIGGDGADQLFGDAGNDALKGGDGIDNYFAGDGNDRIYSGDGQADEPVDGGNGIDRVYFPHDCTLPQDALVSIDYVLMIGTHRLLFCMI